MDGSLPEIVIGDFIRNGSYGACYKATVFDNDRSVSAVIKYVTSTDPKEIKRFKNEANYIERLKDCPHVVKYIYGPAVDENGRNFYLIEEADCNLWDLLTSDTIALSFESSIRLLINICAGMEFAHARRIAHRDLHLGNILIFNNDDSYSAKLCDFGKARDFDADWQHLSSQEWSLPPHVYVNPPERFFSLSLADPFQKYAKVDIYAVGLLAYTIFQIQSPHLIYFPSLLADINKYLILKGVTQNNGMLPGVSDNMTYAKREELYRGWLSSRSINEAAILRVDLAGVAMEKTRIINQIIHKCVHPDHNQRYDSMSELLVELRNVGS
jgi:serine/threonine protein kinase